jgi:hypothetical protein
MYILPISRYEEGEMSRTGDRSSTPRAVIHKRILDIAGSKPDASMAEIADEIGAGRYFIDPGPPLPDTDLNRWQE